jgi:hypothetical protein
LTAKLVYKGSTDGFSGEKFHEKCDFINNTLIIIKSDNNCIFGGFTSQNWSINPNQRKSKLDPNAFIFSLINKLNSPIKLKCQPGKTAIQCIEDFGPVFGEGDICIYDDYSANYTALGRCYIHPLFDKDKAHTFLVGHADFNIVEMEVFQLINF